MARRKKKVIHFGKSGQSQHKGMFMLKGSSPNVFKADETIRVRDGKGRVVESWTVSSVSHFDDKDLVSFRSRGYKAVDTL